MDKYTIIVEGKNLLIKFDKEIKKAGFFTTRFVQAFTPEEAEEKALALIHDELENVVLNERINPPIMNIQAIEKVKSFGKHLVPGKGFTWYFEDAERKGGKENN